MKLPRFGIKALLIVVAFIALWLSTLTGYAGSNDIQAFIWTAIIVMSGVTALSYTGRRRAFWAGFFGTLLLTSTRTMTGAFGFKLGWTQKLSRELATKWQGGTSGRGQLVLNINTTLILLAILVAATVIGFLCLRVRPKPKNRGSLDNLVSRT
jgi:hypothetical protein